MVRTQVLLKKTIQRKLHSFAARTGKSEREIIHMAIEDFISSTPSNGSRLKHLQKARGIWRRRRDLPDFTKLRTEWERM